ncbi:InlB B-repeat-containing protein [Lysinibacillus varians]|uniref:SLH domain-containing protein n=1 Tax=Lysinibacillus varians TaxID=1145276 RepID=A0ABY2TFV0_9BACI|nr:InlB B-repeat-containing protein [Lysinibacillus varians]TKI67257.1 hypothetical protein FC752_01705 [Lysinibacillus varians]
MRKIWRQVIPIFSLFLLIAYSLIGSIPVLAAMNNQTVQQSSLLAASNIIYVNTNAAGGKKDGTSWENAFLDLQSALSKAKTGDQIWIAQGTYIPTRLDDVRDARTAHFKMKNGVAIYGGFKGDSDEETVENRDFTHNKTILSGALPSGEAAYHVFYHPNNYDLKLNATAILDGVTITAGHADGYLTSHMHGGGMYNSGNNPTLRNVIFYGNKANYFGGGMYNLQSSPTLMNVEFTDNEATSGGGIFNWNESAPKLSNVIFNKNKATRSGGGIQNNSCDIIIEHAKFTNNEAAHGGGIANYGNSASTLTDVTFSQNIASQQGGGIYNNGPGNKSILTNVMFEQNKAAYFGGGIVNDRESSPKFTDVIFRNNESDSGGAMFNANRSAPELNNVEFHGNIAISRGGGIYNRLQSNPLITNVIFNGNKSELGGGLLNESGNPSLINALFISNNANKGSALYNIFADFSLINATIYSNSPAAIYGGAANSKIINSIIIGNGHTAALTDYQGQTTKSLLDVPVERGYKGQLFDATSNPTRPATYVPDDVFVSPTSGNLHLKVGGPAIDAGNSDAHSIATDLAGKRRIQGAAIDLGVYETTPYYTVTYNANGATSGIVPQDSTQYEENKIVTVQGNIGNLVKDGYLFAGWNTQADGQGEPYFADETFQIGTTDVILYAQWIKNHYTVTYDANGATSGQVPQDSALYEENEVVTVQGNSGNLVRDGYLFAGWNTQADGQGAAYNANATFQIGTADVILYAHWTKPNTPTYTVTYDANGAISGTVPQDSALYEENEMVTVQGNSGQLVRTGYTFAGWNTQADGQGTGYNANATFPMGTADVILYAHWTKPNTPTYTVIYHANGATSGTVPQDSTQYEENKTVTVQGNSGQLVRTGYTFAGWNTQADGKGISYVENATFQMGKADVTLYAQWASNPSTPSEGNVTGPSASEGTIHANPSRFIQISLETNGGLSLKDIEIAYNTTVNDLPIPTREGFRFAGWYQDKELTKLWDKGMLVKESLTLYAKWTALPEEEAINSQPPKTPQPLQPIVTFQDIENHWAQEIIEALATQGVITGYKDGTFRPNETISRQHVAVLLTRAFTFEASRPSIAFSDVASHHPYYHEITILQQAGIIDGIDGAFHPADHLTRAQLAKILANTLQLQPQTTSSFTDVDSSHWSAGYIGALERAGIALGDNGKFRPEAFVTRAQLAAFLYRAMQQ